MAKHAYDLAIADYSKAQCTWIPNCPTLTAAGGSLTGRRRILTAQIADYTEALRLNPKDTITYFNRAETYQVKGMYRQAIQDATEAIRLDPKNAAAYCSRGTAYGKTCQYNPAISDFNEAIRLNQNCLGPISSERPHIWSWESMIGPLPIAQRPSGSSQIRLMRFILGNVYFQQGEYVRAFAEYTEVIQLNPQMSEAYYNRANVYACKGEFDRVIADSTEAIRLARRHQASMESSGEYMLRGYAYGEKRDYDRAIVDLTEAIA